MANRIEEAIDGGLLRPGDRLPPIRALAEGVESNPTTVAAAYRQLQQRGLVYSDRRRGTRVTGPQRAVITAAMSTAPMLRDLSRGEPDPALLPDLGRVLSGVSQWRHTYAGSPVLEELSERCRVELDADHIPSEYLTVVGGAVDGIERALNAHLRPGDRIALEDPCFGRTLDLARSLNLTIEPVGCDGDGPLPDHLGAALKKGARAFVLTPRAQNPTGGRLEAGRADELRAVLAAHPETLLIEDDHAALIVPDAGVSLVGGHEGPWVVLRSFAKALGPDLRVAVATGDASTIGRIERRLRLGTGWVSHTLQAAVAAMLGDPQVRRLLTRAAKAYDQRRRALVDALTSLGVEAQGKSGLNVWVPVRQETAAVHALAQAGWAVLPGEHFRIASGPALRITSAALDPADASEFAELFSSLVLRNFAGKAPLA